VLQHAGKGLNLSLKRLYEEPFIGRERGRVEEVSILNDLCCQYTTDVSFVSQPADQLQLNTSSILVLTH